MSYAYIYTVSGKRDRNYSCNIFYNTQAISLNFDILSCINLLQNYLNVSHLTWIVCLHYLVKLEMLIAYVLPLSWVVRERKKLQNLTHLTCDLQIRQIWIQLIIARGNTARKVYKTDHWSGRTERATENGVGQAGSRRHCGSHSSLQCADQRALRLVVDILSTVSDFHHCTVSDFCCRCWQHKQLHAICRPILAYCPFWHCDAVI